MKTKNFPGKKEARRQKAYRRLLKAIDLGQDVKRCANELAIIESRLNPDARSVRTKKKRGDSNKGKK